MNISESDLEEFYKSQKSRSNRSEFRKKRKGGVLRALLLWTVLIAAASLCVWASRAELETVVTGTGRVIPDSQTQVIQSLEGGIIEELLVKEGDAVKKGEVLVRLHDVQYSSIHQGNVVAREKIEARMIRLSAEAAGKTILEFPEELEKGRPDIVIEENGLFESRRDDREKRIKFAELRLKNKIKKYELLRPSFESGSLSDVDKLELETQIIELEEEISTLKTSAVRVAWEQYDEQKERLSTLIESMEGDKDRMSRAVIRSPVNGVVNAIMIDTAGRVVGPGEPMMEIVPEGDSLLIETEIRPSDIGFLHKNQNAIVQFTAFDFSIYGGLDGEVETIGVDTVLDPEGNPFYPIKVRTKRNSLGDDSDSGEQLNLVPGMVANVSIITGRKTVLEYILKPIKRAKTQALRER